jgi:hypothetical protein
MGPFIRRGSALQSICMSDARGARCCASSHTALQDSVANHLPLASGASPAQPGGSAQRHSCSCQPLLLAAAPLQRAAQLAKTGFMTGATTTARTVADQACAPTAAPGSPSSSNTSGLGTAGSGTGGGGTGARCRAARSGAVPLSSTTIADMLSQPAQNTQLPPSALGGITPAEAEDHDSIGV